MIKLTRINHQPLVVNADLIEHIEATPDTILSMTNGQKLVVLESVDEVIQRVIDFRHCIYSLPAPPATRQVDGKSIPLLASNMLAAS